MKRLAYALAVVVFLLLSCGDTHTSSKTSSLTFEEFKAKLRQLAGSGPSEMVTCKHCGGTGKVRQSVTKDITCKKCKGTGRLMFKCVLCGGSGKVKRGGNTITCDNCKGSGKRPGGCDACNGRGKIPTQRQELVQCEQCKGKGKYGFQHDPTVEQFTHALGEPEKVQQVAGQVTYYYTCKDGMIQMDVSFDGPRTDPETHIALDLNPNLY